MFRYVFMSDILDDVVSWFWMIGFIFAPSERQKAGNGGMVTVPHSTRDHVSTSLT